MSVSGKPKKTTHPKQRFAHLLAWPSAPTPRSSGLHTLHQHTMVFWLTGHTHLPAQSPTPPQPRPPPQRINFNRDKVNYKLKKNLTIK